MDNGTQNTAPIIPAGTESMHNAVYNPLPQVNRGQAAVLPSTDKSSFDERVAQQSSETDAPRGTTFDDLAAKKGFKSADDLAAAYQNLESQNKRVEMSLSELVDSRLQSPATDDVSPEELANAQSQEAALKIVEKVVRKFTRPLEDKLALQDLMAKNPDATQYASEMAKLVKNNPGIGWDVAYKAAKFDQLAVQARDEGRTEAYRGIQKKQAFTVEAPKAVVKDSKPLLDLIKDRSVPFSEVSRIMKERFRQ